ncbi:hypothetical protein DL95DRAFT_407747 [Leptodontidium sp. 2 PMI_412]|nr:hypothetical protein DL95DRAFT_407747 [Leptodontidium sp. 2 PMI_412]
MNMFTLFPAAFSLVVRTKDILKNICLLEYYHPSIFRITYPDEDMMAAPVANAAFIANYPLFLAEYRNWFQCNNPNAPVPSNGQIIANWRTTPFARGVIAATNANLPARPAPTLMTAALIQPPVPPAVAHQAAFLDQKFAPRGIGKRPANWKGVKILGTGGSGRCKDHDIAYRGPRRGRGYDDVSKTSKIRAYCKDSVSSESLNKSRLRKRRDRCSNLGGKDHSAHYGILSPWLAQGSQNKTPIKESQINRTGQVVVPTMPPEVIVHFDMKPVNNEDFRRKGTTGWFAPEQFTPRWDSSDFLTSTVCGRYGTATNIWGIGTIMYEAFSNALKDLTEECLFEDPSLRPSLGNLKTRIRAGIAACQNNNLVQDNWYDMEVPDPETVRAAETAAEIAAAIARAAAQLPPLPAVPAVGPRRGRFRRATLKATRGWPV